ncbi:hypothetical protein BN1723_008824 [Verticillium longisporum]|uniref:DNA replication ATP-dependent helicase/nuclease n=1 Tax=Verticillium longisporum TaxID=100787 RepID=A0A0G4KIX2_VERLO|nr:hypothetical protein BN1723_008824 [Verticillium longisporum]
MPLPQRSHSAYEQNRFAKSRAQWQRAKTHSATGQTTSNRPLAPVSEKTRNKLTEFQFQPPSDVVDLTSTPPKKDDQQDTCRPPVSQDATSMTPAGRVSLKDLMAREPKPSIEIEHLSPNERIMWNNKEDPAYSSMISPMISRRHRKRARSSSPISSPCTDMAPTPVPAVDVKKLGAALRSPHADPTLELWDRFSLGNRGGLATPLGATNTSLAQFMVSSSPRPPKGAVPSTEAGFRRTLSNGLNWPKRRRFDRPETLGMSARNSQSFGDASKSSLVTALLDTVESKQEFTSPASATGKDMASESPCPQKRSTAVNGNAHDRTPSSSPYKQERPKHGIAQNQDHAVKQDLGLGIVTQSKPESDYGDDDFMDDDLLDDDTLMQLDLTTTQPPKPASQAHMGPPPSPLENVHKPVDFLDDDFDDDLDDNIIEAAGLMMDHFEKTNASQAPSQPVRAHHPSPPKLAPAAAKDDPEDEFGDDFGDFDFDAAEMAATQSAKQPTLPLPATQKPKAIQRYLVTNVLESEYLDDHGRTRLEKMLLVQVEKTKIVRTVHLRGDWYETPAHEKSFVHIIGDFDAEGRCVINDDQNMVILHPDQLISATVVADSFTCTRRAVLQDRVKATSEASAPLVYGTMLHEVFQAALLANQWDLKYLSAVIDTIMEKHVEDLYKIKVSTNIAKEHLQSKMPELSSWAHMFVASQPKPDAMVSDRNGKKVNMCVSKLLDVEEHVWSPMYGLKGNIDATVQVTMKDGNDTRVLTVPFEVKTGKNANTSHVAQTSLYNLLLTDRYDIEIVYGILYYMESSQTSRIPAIRQELRHMIMQRNQLACHIRERSVQLPPMKKSKHMCNKCYAKPACFIYHRLADNGDDVTSGMGKAFDEVVRHLTPTHQEFFIKWENLLTKEEKESQKLRRELWTMVSKEREKLGRCFSDVKTTTIAHIIRALVSQGKSVLLTSYTHTAVDNILLKLKDDSIPVLRLGAPAKVHPEVQEFATLAAVPMHSFDEIKSAWHDPPIVATTCLGIGHHVFNERTFDYCIVDEASQITLPICLGPIRMAKTFVLVGDHNQLPPLVQNEEAREGGLDVSLFKLLSDTHPDSVVNLEHQYRMCEDIMTLSNSLIYKGRLRCGTEQLRFTKLDVPNMGALRQRHFDSAHLLQPSAPRSFCTGPAPGRCWIRDLLEPEARVRFINTDTLQPRTHEEAKGNRIVNPGEARVVTQLVESLVAVGVAETEIGVMTHYRSQLALLKHGLRGHPSVEMHTADRFQGRDKEVVVLSLVRSNDACAIGDLLKDWRRINVAFTRAKTKLLVVGSRETLKGAGHDEMLARFISLMESKAWVYDLPADALESHVSDDAATQASTAAALSPVKARPGFGGPVKAIGGLKGFDKENQRPEPKRAMAGETLLTKNRPITRDILNDMTNGAY